MSNYNFTYHLANRHGYKFEIANIETDNYDKLAYWNKTAFRDVLISRPSIPTNLNLMHSNALLTVNGYIYNTVQTSRGIFIENAVETMLKTKTNQIGFINFNSLDTTITKTPITSSMITTEPNHTLYSKALLTFPHEIGTYFLVLGGYLILPSSEYLYRTSPNTLSLSLDKLLFIEKLYETQKYRNIFTTLNLTTSVNNNHMLDVAQATSNETIVNYLTLHNTFLVELPVTNLQYRQVFLERSNIPSLFRTEIEPTSVLIGGYGKILEYTKRKSVDNKYQIDTLDSYYNNYLFSALDKDTLRVVNNSRVPDVQHRLSHAYFLELFSI